MLLMQVSELPHDSYRHLAWHLMYARHLDSDLNKARLALGQEYTCCLKSVTMTTLL